MTDPATLFEFVGIVLPLSFVGFRILLDELEEASGVPDGAESNRYVTHLVWMAVALVAAGWLAILELLVAPTWLPLAELGYLSAAAGITVPVWLLLTLRNDLDVTDVSERA
ncbi:hypothetical protein [Haloplanus pelagicus]|jgi:hypothetical protein|uniref:hypothetical protein n=1 Tax=Haloplanus pelagicus TaxID=2949995 RepID=UPI00203F6CFD|nr:hypothetical protein [Haloplanus sp. HW8-1]